MFWSGISSSITIILDSLQEPLNMLEKYPDWKTERTLNMLEKHPD
jgi:hypothetical protein